MQRAASVPVVAGAGWRDAWAERLEQEPWLLGWLSRQRDGTYWRHGSLRPGSERIVCPTLLVGGWADGYRNNTLRTFAALGCEKRLLLGPWSHMSAATSLPGPHLELVPELVRWFGRWLRDDENGLDDEPPIRVPPTRRWARGARGGGSPPPAAASPSSPPMRLSSRPT